MSAHVDRRKPGHGPTAATSLKTHKLKIAMRSARCEILRAEIFDTKFQSGVIDAEKLDAELARTIAALELLRGQIGRG